MGWFFKWAEGGDIGGSVQRSGLSGLLTPSGRCCKQESCSWHLEEAVDLWPFGMLLLIIAAFAPAYGYFESLIASWYSIAGGDICVQVQALQERVPGPSLPPTPGGEVPGLA